MKFSLAAAIGIVLYFTSAGISSQDSIGPNGIESAGLGLDGSGITVGQVEGDRPGKYEFDTATNCCSPFIVPLDVFVIDQSGPMIRDKDIGNHPMWVAGVIISSQTSVPTGSTVACY